MKEMQQPTVLALDFDGVICDGLAEYFQTSWRVYQQIWGEDHPSVDLEPQFQRLRPVIETGWEMPILLRALVQGIGAELILKSWPEIAREIVQLEQLDSRELAHQIDGTRDHWIQSDLQDWIRYHRLYPGVHQQLHHWLSQSDLQLQIITTKEGRFAHQILQAQGIEISQDQITGKESGVPKSVSLRRLLSPETQIWFVEDRFKTLELVQAEADLSEIKLFLAEWGYVTQRDQQQAKKSSRIKLLSLDQFSQSFDQWLI